MARSDFEDLEVYQLSEEISDRLWQIVSAWDWFAKRVVGTQLCKAADSVGANIVEGVGRWNYADNKRHVRIARGSLYETKHWLRRAYKRGLLNEDHVKSLRPLMDQLLPKLNAYLSSIGREAATNARATAEPRD